MRCWSMFQKFWSFRGRKWKHHSDNSTTAILTIFELGHVFKVAAPPTCALAADAVVITSFYVSESFEMVDQPEAFL